MINKNKIPNIKILRKVKVDEYIVNKEYGWGLLLLSSLITKIKYLLRLFRVFHEMNSSITTTHYIGSNFTCKGLWIKSINFKLQGEKNSCVKFSTPELSNSL